jgi:hypothetical protein
VRCRTPHPVKKCQIQRSFAEHLIWRAAERTEAAPTGRGSPTLEETTPCAGTAARLLPFLPPLLPFLVFFFSLSRRIRSTSSLTRASSDADSDSEDEKVLPHIP